MTYLARRYHPSNRVIIDPSSPAQEPLPVVLPGQVWKIRSSGRLFRVRFLDANVRHPRFAVAYIRNLESKRPVRATKLSTFHQGYVWGYIMVDAGPQVPVVPECLRGFYTLPAEGKMKERPGELVAVITVPEDALQWQAARLAEPTWVFRTKAGWLEYFTETAAMKFKACRPPEESNDSVAGAEAMGENVTRLGNRRMTGGPLRSTSIVLTPQSDLRTLRAYADYVKRRMEAESRPWFPWETYGTVEYFNSHGAL